MASIYCIERLTFFPTPSPVGEFHYVMFHGIAHRSVGEADKWTPREWGFLGYNVKVPLSIIRPGNVMPALYQPDTNLIVDESIATALRQIPNIEMLPVQFEKLFEINYKKGDMWWYNQGTMPRDPDHYARNTPDEREKFEPIPKHFEVLSWRLQDIVENYSDCRLYRCKLINKNYKDRAKFKASETMLREHPIVWNGPMIVSERIFEILEPHIDRDLFSFSKAKPV